MVRATYECRTCGATIELTAFSMSDVEREIATYGTCPRGRHIVSMYNGKQFRLVAAKEEESDEHGQTKNDRVAGHNPCA